MPGDGIGPEMMGHVKDIFRVAGVPIDFETVKLDSTTDNYDDLHNAIQSVKRNGCALKGNVEAKINRPDIKVCYLLVRILEAVVDCLKIESVV